MKRRNTDHITINNNLIVIGNGPNAGKGEIKFCDMTMELAKLFINYADIAMKEYKGFLDIADQILKKFYGKYNIAGPVDESCCLVFVLNGIKFNIFRH